MLVRLLAATCFLWSFASCYAHIPFISLPNIELPALEQAESIGPVDPQQEITFTVWLKLNHVHQLKKTIEAIYDPHNKHYQQFLTRQNYVAQYAPPQKAVQTVIQYFEKQGLKTHQQDALIKVTGKAAQIEKVLKITLNTYRYHQKTVYGNTSAPKISPDIARYITGISDLSNIPYAHPKIYRQPLTEIMEKPHNLYFEWTKFKPQAQPTTTSLQGFSGQQMRTAYNLNGVLPINGQPIDGTGQTIVIIDGCGIDTPTDIMNDANTFSSANGLPLLGNANFAVVDDLGQPYVPGSMTCDDASSWDGEIALDVQAVHTTAPGANIVLAMTNNVNNTQVAGIINIILNHQFTIGGFSHANVISNSWDNSDDLQNEPLDDTLAVAATMGLNLNFAAGDCGDQTYNSSWPCGKLSNDPSIQFPVSSAYVTAVAGSSLFVDNNYQYAFESGWGNYRNGHPFSGSMGGISQWRNFPAWQTPIAGFTAGGYGVVGTHNRAIPDIAMDADYFTGLIIYQGGTFYKTGGASQSTPLFSGVLALVNQARQALNKDRLGLAAPYFYAFNNELLHQQALNLITPPHVIISGATPVDNAPIGSDPPTSAFNIQIGADIITFNWDGVLSIIENQFWNNVVGVGSPNVPHFINVMAHI